MPNLLQINKQHPDCCSINLEEHLEQTLGQPIKLPPTLGDRLSDDWANQCEEDLLALFELITGVQYEQAHRDNSYNQDSDLDSFMVWTVYAPVGCADWCWQRDLFVVVEIGAGGDPRYCSYGPAKVYRLDDVCLGDCGFLDWRLGWWLEPVAGGYDRDLLDNLNDRCSSSYSSSPYCELEGSLYAPPVWNDRRQCFLARPRGIPYPCKVLPVEPCYG